MRREAHVRGRATIRRWCSKAEVLKAYWKLDVAVGLCLLGLNHVYYRKARCATIPSSSVREDSADAPSRHTVLLPTPSFDPSVDASARVVRRGLKVKFLRAGMLCRLLVSQHE